MLQEEFILIPTKLKHMLLGLFSILLTP